MSAMRTGRPFRIGESQAEGRLTNQTCSGTNNAAAGGESGGGCVGRASDGGLSMQSTTPRPLSRDRTPEPGKPR